MPRHVDLAENSPDTCSFRKRSRGLIPKIVPFVFGFGARVNPCSALQGRGEPLLFGALDVEPRRPCILVARERHHALFGQLGVAQLGQSRHDGRPRALDQPVVPRALAARRTRFRASRSRKGRAGAPLALGRMRTIGTAEPIEAIEVRHQLGKQRAVLMHERQPHQLAGLVVHDPYSVGALPGGSPRHVRWPASTFSGRWCHSKQTRGTAARCGSPAATSAACSA